MPLNIKKDRALGQGIERILSFPPVLCTTKPGPGLAGWIGRRRLNTRWHVSIYFLLRLIFCELDRSPSPQVLFYPASLSGRLQLLSSDFPSSFLSLSAYLQVRSTESTGPYMRYLYKDVLSRGTFPVRCNPLYVLQRRAIKYPEYINGGVTTTFGPLNHTDPSCSSFRCPAKLFGYCVYVRYNT